MRSIKPAPKFNAVFAAVLSLTLASGSAGLHLSAQPNLTEAQNRLLNSALATWTMGTTTLIGLLSNRPQDPQDKNDDSQKK